MHRFVKICGAVGVLLALHLMLHLFFPGSISRLPLLTREIELLLSLGLIIIWLISLPGYKRFPFVLNLFLGTLLVLLVLIPHLLPVGLNEGILIGGALIFFLVSRYCALSPELNPRRFGRLVPLTLLLLLGLFNLALPAEDRIAYGGELDPAKELIAKIHPFYREVEGLQDEIEGYLKDEIDERELTIEEQEELIAELNRHILQLEGELSRFSVLNEENRRYADEIDRLRDTIGELESNREEGLSIEKVTSMAAAIRSDSPRVRDFAVKLATAAPGSYYRYSGGSTIPSKTGIRQILAIHRYIAAEWDYINDPISGWDDYYSPADRTIALGLAGDCDDFAILIAACIEAVGGRARILHGTCGSGAHAWCEAYIGDRAVWDEATRIIGDTYPGSSLSYLTPQNANDYWLCLDWQVGVYSCGENPSYLYETTY